MLGDARRYTANNIKHHQPPEAGHLGQIGEGGQIVGLQPERLPVAAGRLLRASQKVQDGAQVGVSPGFLRSQLHSLPTGLWVKEAQKASRPNRREQDREKVRECGELFIVFSPLGGGVLLAYLTVPPFRFELAVVQPETRRCGYHQGVIFRCQLRRPHSVLGRFLRAALGGQELS
uniref:Uncharacterized protein n=1 Tax=Anopheles atroparvus TaxID=41427 RepID=A0A182IZ65_ANOAO